MKVLVSGAAGKLGSMLAAKMVQLGHTVLVTDVAQERLQELRCGNSCGYADYDKHGMMNTQLFDDFSDTVDCELIVVDTPSKHDGSFDVSKVMQRINSGHKHQMIVVSTVNPGDTPPGVIYMPTLIALGEINFTRLIFAGIDNDKQAALVEALWRDFPVHFCTRIEAELVKLGINAYLTTKISYANALGMVCQSKGADPKRVLSIMGLDDRIGSKFFSPGLPFGGPCLPRDTNAMRQAVYDCKFGRALHMMMQENNECNKDLVLKLMNMSNKPGARSIGIIGMAYKPGVPYTWESLGIMLKRMIETSFFGARTVYTFCPWANHDHRDHRAFHADVVYWLHGTHKLTNLPEPVVIREGDIVIE